MIRVIGAVTPYFSCLLLTFSCVFAKPLGAQTLQAPSVIDIDGNAYRTVRIGTQLWTAENLRVSHDPGGNPIESYFFQDDSLQYSGQGRLYTWGVAMNDQVGEEVQGICPENWHLPSDAEWMELFAFMGDADDRGKALLPGESTGFDAILSGGADFRGNYLYFGTVSMFWSSTEVSEDRAYHHGMDRDGEVHQFAAMKGARIHVRCVMHSR